VLAQLADLRLEELVKVAGDELVED